MPVLGTTAFPQASEVFQLVRSMLMDADVPFTVTIGPIGAVRNSGIATITTTSPHNLQVNDIVQVASVTDSTFSGTQTIIAVPTGSSFQYVNAGANATSGNGIVSPVVQGDVWTDTVLLPLANKAYRKVQTRLLENGSSSTTTEVVIPNFPAGATQLLDTTSPQLPVDFLAPRTLRERIVGQLYFGAPMGRVDMLPSCQQQPLNGVYAWFEDGLNFLGATSATDLSLRYFLALPDVSGKDGFFTLRGSQDSIASHAAYLACQSRNPQVAAIFKQQFEEDMEEMLNLQAHARQYKTGRRRPNNAGRRGFGYGYGYQR